METPNQNLNKHNMLWSKTEDQFIIDHHKEYSDEWIAEQLGRTKIAVYSRKITHLSLAITRKGWSEDEIKFLKENWETNSDEWMAEKLGRGVSAVAKMRSVHGFVSYKKNRGSISPRTLLWRWKMAGLFIAVGLGFATLIAIILYFILA